MAESPMAISASHELLRAAPCMESDPIPTPAPVPITGSDPVGFVVGSGITGDESLEDFRLPFQK